jgi:hypothetical protein
MSVSSTRGAGRSSVAGRRPNVVFGLRSELSRLSDEIGYVEPHADPRRFARNLTREHT